MIRTRFITLFLLILGLVLTLKAQDEISSIHRDNSKTVYKNQNPFSSFDVEIRGKIEVTDDDKDVKSLSPGGYLEVKKTVFGSKRTLIISNEGNTIRKEYYEGRTKIPFEPAGKAWMGEILPELVRTTTIGAEGRVDRFYKKGGVNAVLNEIDLLESNHVKSYYGNLLLKQPVNQKEYAHIIDRMASTMDSNHYLAGFLKDNLDKFVKNNDALEATFRATNTMDSDHYKTEVIKSGLDAPDVSLNAMKIIMRSASNMDSDHYKTEVLKSILSKNNLSDEVVDEMILATQSIDSDFYRSVVLNNALTKDGLSKTSFQHALESIKNIDSDHYKSEVMKTLIVKPITQDLQITLIDLTNSIDSDHYSSIVLEELLEHQELDNQAFTHLIERAGYIDSDHYASEVMKDALSRNLSEANLISLLQAAGKIESDHYITEVLGSAAPQVKRSSDKVKEAYRKAANQIESETYYGRAIRALEGN